MEFFNFIPKIKKFNFITDLPFQKNSKIKLITNEGRYLKILSDGKITTGDGNSEEEIFLISYLSQGPTSYTLKSYKWNYYIKFNKKTGIETTQKVPPKLYTLYKDYQYKVKKVNNKFIFWQSQDHFYCLNSKGNVNKYRDIDTTNSSDVQFTIIDVNTDYDRAIMNSKKVPFTGDEYGCWFITPRCPNNKNINAINWQKDNWGCANKNACKDKNACLDRKKDFDTSCGANDTIMYYREDPNTIKAKENSKNEPSSEGCYYITPTGCSKDSKYTAIDWKKDDDKNAYLSRSVCFDRKQSLDSYCGIDDTIMGFKPNKTSKKFQINLEWIIQNPLLEIDVTGTYENKSQLDALAMTVQKNIGDINDILIKFKNINSKQILQIKNDLIRNITYNQINKEINSVIKLLQIDPKFTEDWAKLKKSFRGKGNYRFYVYTKVYKQILDEFKKMDIYKYFNEPIEEKISDQINKISGMISINVLPEDNADLFAKEINIENQETKKFVIECVNQLLNKINNIYLQLIKEFEFENLTNFKFNGTAKDIIEQKNKEIDNNSELTDQEKQLLKKEVESEAYRQEKEDVLYDRKKIYANRKMYFFINQIIEKLEQQKVFNLSKEDRQVRLEEYVEQLYKAGITTVVRQKEYINAQVHKNLQSSFNKAGEQWLKDSGILTAVDSIGDWSKNLEKNIGQISGGLQQLGDNVLTTIERTQKAGQIAAEKVKELSEQMNILKTQLTKVLEDTGVKDIILEIINFLKKVPEIIENIIKLPNQILTELSKIKDIPKNTMGLLEPKFQEVENNFNKVLESTKNQFKNLGDLFNTILIEPIKKALETLVSEIGDKLKVILEFAKNIMETVINFFGEIGKIIIDIPMKIIETLFSGFKFIFELLDKIQLQI